jgi:hypothetical protein
MSLGCLPSHNIASFYGISPLQDIYDVAHTVASSLASTTSKLVDWQQIYAGLPDPLLRDATFNLFNHLRSSMYNDRL